MITGKVVQIASILNAEHMQISECVWPPYWCDADAIIDEHLEWHEQKKVPLSVQRFLP